MTAAKIVILSVLVPFVLFTVWVVANGGPADQVLTALMANPWIGQISFDLILALSMVLVWIWRDAHQRGKNPIPWVIATLFMGSIAPLIYLLLRPEAPADGT